MDRSLCFICLLGLLAGGCASTNTSNTARTAQEQLLISNSIDQALDKVDFTAFSGAAVYVDPTYLECVDKQYLLASVRHRVLRGGSRIVEKTDEADVIVELRSGGVGTANSDMFIGMPKLALPLPLPISLPEVRLISKQMQTGTAKIGLVAFDAKTRRLLGDGGVTLARSDDNNWYVLGMGPYQNGTMRHEMAHGVNTPGKANQPLPYNVAFDAPQENVPPVPGKERVQWAGSTDDGSQVPATIEPAGP